MKKISYIIFSMAIISCDKNIDNVQNSNVSNEKVVNNEQNYNSNKSLEPDDLLSTKYCFVVFEGQSYMSHEGYRRIVTSIFETKSFINEDEEYKLIDNSQTKSLINSQLKNVDKRYLRYYFSYSEASKEREKLLGINQSNRQQSYKNKQNNEYIYDSVSSDSTIFYFVIKPKSFFYREPNLNTRKKTYLLRDARVRALDETEYFIYINFTNSDGVTSKGWILKDDISKY